MRFRSRASAAGLAVSLALAPGAGAEPRYRIAMNLLMWGPMSTDTAHAPSNKKRSDLAWLSRLGYTHVLYGLGDLNAYGDPKDIFRQAPGRGWTYNGGDYAGGGMAASFRAMKAAVEKEGMRLIPFLETLSHVHCLIALDSSIAEIEGWDAYCKDRGVGCGYGSNHVAALADSSGKPGNPGADQFFREYMLLFKANWGTTLLGGRAPEAVHIGHDELGGYARSSAGEFLGPVGYVKAGRSRGSPFPPSELVASEISERASEVEFHFGPGIDVMFFGDSFLPGDIGEKFGLVGKGPSGEGGVLWLLRHRHAMEKRLIVMPWGYSNVDGEHFPGPNVKPDRRAQLAYLNRLGFRYIPGTGEDGGAEPYSPRPGPTRKALWQWYAAALAEPQGLAGFAHLAFDDLGRCEEEGKTCVGHTAPLLAWLAWRYPGSGEDWKRRGWSEDLFTDVDGSRSVRERAWKEGEHYSRPAFRRWWEFWK